MKNGQMIVTLMISQTMMKMKHKTANLKSSTRKAFCTVILIANLKVLLQVKL